MATTVITNVKVFNGIELIKAEEIVIENGLITNKIDGDIVIDGKGCTLLPGLIDSHIHLYKLQNLEEAVKYGVTTMLDMGTRSPNIVDNLRNHPELPDIRSSYSPAFAKGSKMPVKMGYPETSIVISSADADRFVSEQVAYGADYIKIILEDWGINGGVTFPPKILTAIVESAHRHGKLVIAHAVTSKAFKSAVRTSVDVLTHIPFIKPLPQRLINNMAAKGLVAIPTMVTMQGIIDSIKQVHPRLPFNYDYVKQSVADLDKAGIIIMAGSDANTDDPTTPFSAPYGKALLEELELMVQAGLTPVQAIQSATSVPAKYFGLNDRGIIKPGHRADLLLVEGDPISHIEAIRNIKQVWIAGNAVIK